MREPTRQAVMCAIVVALVGVTGVASASQRFTDARGDAGPAADIESVSVDIVPATAQLQFLISTPNRAQLATDDGVFVYVDLDPDRTPAFSRLDYELIISKSFICRRRPETCAQSWGFAYANPDRHVSMMFNPERAIPIEFKVVTVHSVDGRAHADSGPDRGTSRRARHYRIEPSVFAEACVVPNVRGMRVVIARRAIVRAHCKVGRVRPVGSSTRPSRVLRQMPPPRALQPRGGRVDLVVSSRRS